MREYYVRFWEGLEVKPLGAYSAQRSIQRPSHARPGGGFHEEPLASLRTFDNQHIKNGKERFTTRDGQLLQGDGKRAVQHPEDYQERLQQVETETGAGSILGAQ